MTDNYGAKPEDWGWLELGLGLGDDLLPVVSNPNAVISDRSKMKGIGKTPSIYNHNRQAVGLSKWTDRMADKGDLAKWSAEPDYGICIQTRRVRALDIDVTDQEEADAIWTTIAYALGGGQPTRRRANSSKCLTAFIIEGDIPKRVFKTKHGIVEFLATGQQFVAHGTHTSGERYTWDHLDGFPILTLVEFDALWDKLVELFAIEPSKEGKGPRLNGTDLAIHDPMTERLHNAGLILGYGNDGQAFIECPWKEDHSSDSGETECAYFPAGTRGYAVGHYKCLHASHMNKTDFEFERDLLGINDDFEDLPDLPAVQTAEKRVAKGQLKLARDKQGIDASITNIARMLDASGTSGVEIVKDVFLDEHMVREVGSDRWEMIDDLKQVQLRSKLEIMGFKEIGREKMRDGVALVGAQNKIDSAQQWLTAQQWDGTLRVESFFERYFGGISSNFTRAVGYYLWSALAGRVMVPGIQADMMPIFVGDQGLGKSSAIRLLAPRPELFTELSFHMDQDDQARQMKGKLVVEIAELTGLHTREIEVIKAFITRRVEEWIPKYQEKATFYARRALLIGTTNRTDILADTENRRFLPVAVGQVDREALERDRNQLWAEGAVLFQKNGVMWQDAQTLAPEVQQAFRVTDSWEEGVDHWLADIEADTTLTGGVLRTRDILQDAIGMDPSRVKKHDEDRIRRIMLVRGYKYGTFRDGDTTKKGWRK